MEPALIPLWYGPRIAVRTGTMTTSHRRRCLAGHSASLAALVWALVAPGMARAEVAFGIYGGAAITADCDVTLVQNGGTRLTFQGVSWADESLSSPIYYGARLAYWFGGSSHWGVIADFTHAKMLAELDRKVAVSGTRAGAPVSGTETLGDTFDQLELSHGFNLLTLNGTYRWLPGRDEGGNILGRIRPYASLGGGVAIPHFEVKTAGATADANQVAGPVLQAGAGADIGLSGRFSFFAEYRLSYADVTGDLSDGGTISLQPWTNHFMLGVSTRLWD